MKTNKLTKKQKNRLRYIKKRMKEVKAKWGIEDKDILQRRKTFESFVKSDDDYKEFLDRVNDKIYRIKDRQEVIRDYNAYNKRIIEKKAQAITNEKGHTFTKEQVSKYKYAEYLANRALKDIKEKYKDDQLTKDYIDTLPINLDKKNRDMTKLSPKGYEKELKDLEEIDENFIENLIDKDRKFLKDIFTKGAMRNLDKLFLRGIEYAIDNANPIAIKNYIITYKRSGIKIAYQTWENVWDDTLTDEYLMSIGNSLIAQLT